MNVLFALLLACGGPAPHEHGHDHDAGHAHDHDADHANHHEDVQPHDGDGAAADEGADAIEAPLGTHTARLEPSADALRLVVLDDQGAPVKAQGQAKIVLTGTGEDPQRVVLEADGDGWSGPARASGAKGYLAVVNVKLGGARQSARLTWGEVPEAAPAPAPHDHPDGEAPHDHPHGSKHAH